MPLTPCAQAWLEELPRRRPVPVEQVAAALDKAGCPAFEVWLDFHRRFAGYEEPLGYDVAIWGIVHDHSWWAAPGVADVAQQPDGSWSVRCAAVHGSYDYRLDQNGCFCSSGGGGPCESFDVKVEQSAFFVARRSDGRTWQYVGLKEFTDGGFDVFRAVVGAELVPAASDKYTSVWSSPDAIWIEYRGEEAYQLYVAGEARGRIAAALRA